MSGDINRPSPQALFTRYKEFFQNTVLGGAQIVEESNEWYAVAVNYAMAEEFYAVSNQAWKERDPRYACCDNLVEIAARDGIYPYAATPAQGYLKLSGTPGTALPSPLEFTVGGLSFVTAYAATQPLYLDASGDAVVRVRAVVPGSTGNVQEDTGNLDTVVANVDTEVIVCGGSFCGGDDSEDCEQFRARYLRRMQFSPRATNQWIMDKLLEWPCSTRAIPRGGSCCLCGGCESPEEQVLGEAGACGDCRCAECGGNLDFYLMFDDSFEHGIPPESVLKEVETWLFGNPQGFGLGQVEIGICGKIVPVTPIEVNTFVDIVDCVTSTDISYAQSIIQEFFTTVEPSRPLNADSLRLSLSRALGASDIDVRFELANPDVDSEHVFETGCSVEPDCDYLLVPLNIKIGGVNDNISGCPT